MVIDNIERLNKVLVKHGFDVEQFDVCTPIEHTILKSYNAIRKRTAYVPVDTSDTPDDIYISSLINVLFHDTRSNPKQELVNKGDLHLARSLFGAEKLKEANEKLAESKKPRAVREKKPVTVEDVTALLDGLDPAVIASIMAKHTKKESS